MMVRYREPSELKLHPLAYLIPDMQEYEWENFIDDIRVNGLKIPLDITSDNIVLDGKNRLRASKELNLKRVPVRIFDVPIDEDEALIHIWRTAVLRRHLTQGQMTAIAIELNSLLKENKLTHDEMAQRFKVSNRNLCRASIVRKKEPELLNDVRDGKLSLGDAEILAKTEEPEVRARAIKHIKKDPKLKAFRAVLQAKQEINKTKTKHIQVPLLPEYKTILADPPWDYEEITNSSYKSSSSFRCDSDYTRMTLEQIADLTIDGKHISEYATEKAHLYLWTTNTMLEASFDILRAWGFEYKTMLTWGKPYIGLGHYFRTNTEHILFATRGNLETLTDNTPTWFQADKSKHSSKPEHIYNLIENNSYAPYLELFARKNRKGWTSWGTLEQT